ncbi:MAG: fructosamine kinase family protein [Mycobacterium sp.]
MRTFVKRNATAPPGFFACEAAGLQWLSTAPGGSPCAKVVAHDEVSLTLEHLETTRPTSHAAEQFGRRLAATHDAGAADFGAPPDGWAGPGFFGPLHNPLPMSLTGHQTWGEFYADERLLPMAQRAAGQLDADTRIEVNAVIKRCRAGDFDDEDGPARLHGDLWSGNVMWTADGVVLVDPAAHGGHREGDIAMLQLFGCPHLDAIVAGYQEVHPLQPGWRERVSLHQLFPLLAHVVLFGSSYRGQVSAAATAALNLS